MPGRIFFPAFKHFSKRRPLFSPWFGGKGRAIDGRNIFCLFSYFLFQTGVASLETVCDYDRMPKD